MSIMTLQFEKIRQPIDAVKDYFDAIVRMDAKACATAFAQRGVMHTPCLPAPYPRTVQGREGIEQVFTLLFTKVFKTFTWVDLELFATQTDSSLIFARARSSAELRNNGHYSNEYACFTHVKEGNICDHTEFFDTVRAIEAFKHLA
jgi:ketosteroid isomerase-like protein